MEWNISWQEFHQFQIIANLSLVMSKKESFYSDKYCDGQGTKLWTTKLSSSKCSLSEWLHIFSVSEAIVLSGRWKNCPHGTGALSTLPVRLEIARMETFSFLVITFARVDVYSSVQVGHTHLCLSLHLCRTCRQGRMFLAFNESLLQQLCGIFDQNSAIILWRNIFTK